MTDITRKRGDTYAEEKEVISATTGLPMNISGYSFLLTVDPAEKPTDDANNVFQVTGVITDATNGLVEFAPSPAQADRYPGVYFYDIQMTDGDGRIRTIETGKYTVEQDITK